MKNVIWLFIFILLVSCSKSETQIEEEIIFVIPSEGSSYDTNLGNETFSLSITSHLTDPLVIIGSNGDLIPAAAESWEISQENKKYTFYLREGLVWSDGVKLTAEHFRDGLLRIIDPIDKPANSIMLTPYIINGREYYNGEVSKDEVGIKVIDDRTLVLELQRSTPFLLDLLTHQIFSPCRLDIINKGGENWHKNPEIAISNGPYILEEYVKDQYTTVVKNHNYWNSDKVKIDRIKFQIRGDDIDIVSKFNNGEVDGVYEVLSSDFRLIPDSDIESFSRLIPSTAFLIVNHDSGILNDDRLRKALSLAIDREKLVKDVLYGAGIPTDYLVPFLYKIGGEPFRDYVDLIKGVDVDTANGLIDSLKQEGIYTGDPIRFFHIETGVDSVASKEIIKQFRGNLGLEIEEQAMPWATLYEKSKSGDFDIIMTGWGADYHHPMTFLSLFIEGSFYKPLLRWHSKEYEAALEKSNLITDDKEYLKELRKIEDMIIGVNHIIPVYHRRNLFLMSERIKGWYTRGVYYIFDEAYID